MTYLSNSRTSFFKESATGANLKSSGLKASVTVKVRRPGFESHQQKFKIKSFGLVFNQWKEKSSSKKEF